MPGTWAYTKSTNVVVVTGGTSGSPAAFADFVIADRAGSVTLLAAWTPNSNTKALTYQITAVEKLALIISFIVAGKTTEADYIFVTGTDAWDNAQTESLDVSAGNGTYATTKRFRTITNIDCSDNSTGGGTVWADGTVAVTQPQWGVIWDHGRWFRVDSHFTIGDGSTSSYFKVEADHSWQLGYASNTRIFNVTANATFIMGSPTAYSAKNGGTFIQYQSASDMYWGNGTKNFYACNIIFYEHSTYALWSSGTLNLYDCNLWGGGAGATWFIIQSSGIFSRTNFSNGVNFYLYTGNTLLTDVQISDFSSSIAISTGLTGDALGVNLKILGSVYYDIDMYTDATKSVTLIDSNIGLTPTYRFVGTTNGGPYCYLKYSCNISVADEDGNALSGVSILCEDQYGTEVFNVSTNDGTGGTILGEITEQIIPVKDYRYNGGGIVTSYSPHKFTISKAGYQTLVLDNVSVDGKIVWYFELQPPATGSDVILLDSGRLAKKLNTTLYLLM